MDIDKINSYVNRAQLSINDWQCSNEADYLRQAQANLGSALELERAARVAALAAEQEEAYSVSGAGAGKSGSRRCLGGRARRGLQRKR